VMEKAVGTAVGRRDVDRRVHVCASAGFEGFGTKIATSPTVEADHDRAAENTYICYYDSAPRSASARFNSYSFH